MEVYSIFAEIEIDGTPVSNYYSIRIKQRINSHHPFSIKLPHEVIETKGTFSLNNVKNFIGKVILIRLYRGTNKKVLNEFKGIISDVSIEQFNAYDSQIVLNGYSPTILLENNPHIACFVQKDLRKICQETTKALTSECQVQINPVYTKQLKYFTQYKESNFEFLNRLSAEFGEWFYYDGKQLYFGKPASSKDIELVSGEDVYSLQLKLQILPMAIKAFSYQSKEDSTLTGNTPSSVNGMGQYGKFAAKESEKLYTEVINTAIRPKAENKADLDNFLKIQKSAIAAELEVISGTSLNPEIILGSTATIFISEKKNNEFSKKEHGKFLITSVTHEFTEDGKYINHFEGVPSAVEVLPVNKIRRPLAEPQVGTVVNNTDPDNLGRVKVKMLWHEGNVTTDWIRILTSDAGKGGKTGKNRGYVFIPEVNDQVLVGFRYNDPDRPFVMGSIFHGKSAAGGGKDNKIKTISSNSGNTITLNDDKGSMQMEDAKGNSVLIDGAGLISVNSTEKIELKCGDSSVTLKKDGTITISGKTKIEILSDQTVNVEGKTEVGVKSTNITAKANGNLNLEGTAVSAKAKANLALEGSAMAKLSSSAMVEIQATLVKIN